MTRRKSLRIIVIVLCMALLVSLIPHMAFAGTKIICSENEFSDKEVATLDATIVSELGSLCTEMSAVKKNDKGDFEYTYTLKTGVEGYAKGTLLKNGDMNYYFKEGNLENTLTRKTDGTLLLDGEEVNVTISCDAASEDESFIESQQIVEPQGKHYNKTSYVDSPPSGTTRDDYSVFVNTYGVDVDFNKTVKSLTVGVIVSILTSGVVAAANAGPVVGLVSGAGTGVLAGVATSLQTNHPLSVGSKIEIKRWQHKNGYQISHSSIGEARFVYKDRLNYYARNSKNEYKFFDYALKYRLTRIYSS